MDKTERKMTKIARELNKLTVQTMKKEGIGTAEFDFIHLVRHHPGITQAQLREELKIDKGAAARTGYRILPVSVDLACAAGTADQSCHRAGQPRRRSHFPAAAGRTGRQAVLAV